MFPDEGRGIGPGLDIQKEKGIPGIDGDLFQKRIIPVLKDAVDPDKPGIFGINNPEFPITSLQGRMTEGHVIRYRVKGAEPRNRNKALLTGDAGAFHFYHRRLHLHA
jgi:hypothetical protein